MKFALLLIAAMLLPACAPAGNNGNSLAAKGPSVQSGPMRPSFEGKGVSRLGTERHALAASVPLDQATIERLDVEQVGKAYGDGNGSVTKSEQHLFKDLKASDARAAAMTYIDESDNIMVVTLKGNFVVNRGPDGTKPINYSNLKVYTSLAKGNVVAVSAFN